MGEHRGQWPGSCPTPAEQTSYFYHQPSAPFAGRRLCALICAKLRKRASENTNVKVPLGTSKQFIL